MNLILYGILGFVLWTVAEAKKFIDSYQIKVKGFKFNNSESAKYLYLKLIGKITLQINNPSQLVASLNKLQLTAWYNGKNVGSLFKNDPVTIQSGNLNYDFNLSLVTLNLFNSVSEAVNAIKAGQSIELTIKGFGEVGKATIPINQTVKIL